MKHSQRGTSRLPCDRNQYMSCIRCPWAIVRHPSADPHLVHAAPTLVGMTEIFETQPDRTDLPLVVMPEVLDAMIEPMKAQLPRLKDIARVRMFEEFTSDDDVIAERLRDADGLFVGGYHIDDDLLRRISGGLAGDDGNDAGSVGGGKGGRVRCIVFCGTGVASYISLSLARRFGVTVCNAEHYGDPAVAEHTFALIFELTRRVGELDRATKAGDWSWKGGDGMQLSGKTLGIVGLGGIGTAVARIAQAFGMRVLAWRSPHSSKDYRSLRVEPVDDLGALMERSDVVSVHLPLVEGEHGTVGLIKAEHLARMRPGTLFVNTARAEVIEPGALLNRLRKGDVQAALDVYDHEPVRADDPLCAIPGIVLTPHVGWRTDGAFAELTRQMVDDMIAFFQGRRVRAVI